MSEQIVDFYTREWRLRTGVLKQLGRKWALIETADGDRHRVLIKNLRGEPRDRKERNHGA